MTAHEDARAWLAEMDDLVKRNGAAGDQALLKQERVARDIVRALLEPPTDEEREALTEQAVWALIDHDTDVADRGVRDEHYRERRADVERILPILHRRRDLTVTDEMVHAADLAIMPYWGERYPSGSLTTEIARTALEAAEEARHG